MQSNSTGTQIIFNNGICWILFLILSQFKFNFKFKGLSIILGISTSKISNTQSLSWVTTSITLDDSINAYSNNTIGLMGNNNGDPTDDIFYRNGTIEYSRSQRTIYRAAIDCKQMFI